MRFRSGQILENHARWNRVAKPSDPIRIRGFMAETDHDFGRFDFLRAGGRLVFLEMNPNGQFAVFGRAR